jgi:2-C-methyl-D-erythritol 2,4-cyclodiphosphate synthase
MSQEFRSGIGYDLHRLAAGRRLILGGVEIPFDKGFEAHSDGDILLHAITDALLGAAGLGDIGELFPPGDPQWKDADSTVFLEQARELIESYGFQVANVDAVVIIERPKILPYRDKIRKRIAEVLGIHADHVGIKAKTAEGVGPIGHGEAAEAHAVAVIWRAAERQIM